jgi:hypothetical protein
MNRTATLPTSSTAFACLYTDGRDLRPEPLAQRREVLEGIVHGVDLILPARRLPADGLKARACWWVSGLAGASSTAAWSRGASDGSSLANSSPAARWQTPRRSTTSHERGVATWVEPRVRVSVTYKEMMQGGCAIQCSAAFRATQTSAHSADHRQGSLSPRPGGRA